MTHIVNQNDCYSHPYFYRIFFKSKCWVLSKNFYSQTFQINSQPSLLVVWITLYKLLNFHLVKQFTVLNHAVHIDWIDSKHLFISNNCCQIKIKNHWTGELKAKPLLRKESPSITERIARSRQIWFATINDKSIATATNEFWCITIICLMLKIVCLHERLKVFVRHQFRRLICLKYYLMN